jgi:hypothetical protein
MLIFSTSIVWSFMKREITLAYIAYEKYSQFLLAYMQSKEGKPRVISPLSNCVVLLVKNNQENFSTKCLLKIKN